MRTKLTLSIPPQAVRQGKRIARLRKQSLSDLVTQFLERLKVEPEQENIDIDPRLAECYGAYKVPAGKNIDGIRMASLIQKHGKRQPRL